MHSTFVASRISLQTLGSIPGSFDANRRCSSERQPFLDTSSMVCCFCSFFGLRQSCLVKWSHCRKVISSGLGLRGYYARLPVCDVSGRCCCDNVGWFGGNGVGWRKGGLKCCRVVGEMGKGYGHGGVDDEVEAVLSLLSEECDGFGKEAKRLFKKSVIEDRDDFEASNARIREDGSVVSLRKVDDRRGGATWREEHENDLQERKPLLRKKSRTEKGRKGESCKLRKENLRVSLRNEEQEFLGREEYEQKVTKEGFSGSSYYSYLTKDYDCNTETKLRQVGFLEDSSAGGHDSKKDGILIRKDHEVNWSGTIERGFHAEFIDESYLRKKSEKKLVDLSVQDSELRKEPSQKETKLLMTHEGNHKKSSDHYATCDDRQAISSMMFDNERKHQIRQGSDELSRQSETRMKYKQFAGMQDSHNDNIVNSYGSQNILSDKREMFTKAASSSQKTVEASKMEDENQRNFHNVSRISEIQEIDVEKTFSSQQSLVANFKEDGNFTGIHSSFNKVIKQQQQSSQESGLIQSKEESPKLNKKISKTTTQQLENLNFASGSSLEYERLPSSNAPKGDHYRKESDVLAELSFSHSQNSGTIDLEGTNKTKFEIVNEKQQKDIVQHSYGDFQPKKHESRSNNQPSEIKGPSDEIWNVDDPSVEEHSSAKVKNYQSNGGNVIVRGSGRSLWVMISDFVRLRWFSHSGSCSSAGRSSPKQSTGSETWFSSHEAEVKVEEAGDKEQKVITQDLPGSQVEGKIRSLVEEGSTSSTIEGHLKHVGMSVPSSSMVLEKESPFHKEEPKQKNLQRKDHFLEDRFDEWENAYKLEGEQQRVDETFMREALFEARKAADNWEVPVGAVLVHDGKIIARGCNLVEEMHDSTAHAEMICIREASSRLQTWRLSETTLYVTLEPCPMCAGAILQARIDTVVWGAPNKLLGADGSWVRLFPNGGRGNGLDKPDGPVHPFHPNIVVRRGVLATNCADEMRQFFKLRRKNKDKKPNSSAKPSFLPISDHFPKLLAKIHRVINIMFCL